MTAFKYSAVLLSMALVNVAIAQTQQIQRDQPANQAGQATDMNTVIATCMLLGNQEEVALAQLAADQAQTGQVKQFAQKLVEDHQKIIQKLQPLAKPGISLNTGSQTAAADQPAGPQPQQYTANRPDLTRGSSNMATVDKILQIDQQATQECLKMARSMLQEKQGVEFDKAFAGMQVGMHAGMLAKLKASEPHASGELASAIQESKQVVEQHLEQAKQICQQLEDQSASSRQARDQ